MLRYTYVHSLYWFVVGGGGGGGGGVIVDSHAPQIRK
jgi:hypothetical protein